MCARTKQGEKKTREIEGEQAQKHEGTFDYLEIQIRIHSSYKKNINVCRIIKDE